MVLARLLTPTDFGLYTMVMAVVGILFMFRDAGVESALVQADKISPAQLATLNSFNATWGFVLALTVLALGPALAAFYDEPRLIGASAAAAASFLIYGFDVQPAALMLRAHRFKTHAIIEFVGLTLGLIAALIFAIYRLGYWALFALDFVVAATLLIGHVKTMQWRPRFGGQWQAVRSMLSFGRTLSYVRLLGHCCRNIDQIIIGWALGPAALAIYAKSIRLVNMPHDAVNWPLTKIAVPSLSRQKNDPAQFRATFSRLNGISATLGLPIVVWIGVSADSIVATLYGPQWTSMVPIVQLVAVLGIFNTVMAGPAWIYVSTAAVKRQIPWEILTFIALTTSLIYGVKQGLDGASIAVVTAGVVLRIGAWLYSIQRSPINGATVLISLWRPVLAATTTTAITFAAVERLPAMASAPILAFVSGLVVLLTYLVIWLIIPQGRQTLISYWRAISPDSNQQGDPVS